MNYSEQAIVVDENGKLYFEDNHVTNMLSFIGGKVKNGEKYGDTVTREVEEELGITFSQDRFLDGQKQAVRSFWNERQQKYIDWQSTYFVLVLLADEVKNIQENVQLIILNHSRELDQIPDEKFRPLGREIFITQVERALSHI